MTKNDLKFGVSSLFNPFGVNVFMHRKLLRIGVLPIDCEDYSEILIAYSYYCTEVMKPFEFRRKNGKMNWTIGKAEFILSNNDKGKVSKEVINEESEIRRKLDENEENIEEGTDCWNLLNQTEEAPNSEISANSQDHLPHYF